MLSLIALTLNAHAEDVILPEPTVLDVTDVGVGFLTYGLLLENLRAGGVAIVDGETLKQWRVPGMDDCATNSSCPANLWPATDARVAVVIKMEHERGGMVITSSLFSAEDAEPFKVYRSSVATGGEAAWALELARNVRDAIPLLAARTIADPSLREAATPKPPPRVRRAAEPEAEPEEPKNLDAEPVVPSGQQRRNVVAPEDRDRGAAAEARLARLHLPRRVRERFASSGLDLDSFLKKEKIRAGQFLLEVHGGGTQGDVHRGYGVQLRIQPDDAGGFERLGTSTWEGPGGGIGPSGAFAVGYAPTWWLDTSVLVGAQVGFKRLVAGWECEEGLCNDTLERFAPEPVRAAQVVIEPRIRLWPVAAGFVKPYALVGFTTMLHDGIEVRDTPLIDYPDAPGGATIGATGGVGLAVDLNSFFSFQLEAPFTWVIPSGPAERIDPNVTTAPHSLGQYGYLARGSGSIAVRF